MMRKRANSTNHFTHTLSEKIGSTLEQRIISAGLDSIRGDDAEFVKDGASVSQSMTQCSLPSVVRASVLIACLVCLVLASLLLPCGHS